MPKRSANTVFLIIILASFTGLFAMPAQSALPQAQDNVEPKTFSYRVKIAQNRSIKKRYKRHYKKRKNRMTKDGRRNFYDSEINDSRGRTPKKGKRNLREEWCLDCFVGI